MKIKNKEIKIISLFVVLALIFLFSFNITYSYFTSTHQASGDINFSNLNVRFAYTTTASMASPIVVTESTLSVRPSDSSGTISRGTTFQLALEDGTDLSYLAFNASSDSCSSYIRFRINAYQVEDGNIDNTVNYGRYFEISGSGFTSSSLSVNNVTNTIYYMTNALNANQTVVFATGIKLLEEAPVDLLNSQVRLYIEFEAVQSANQAYLSVFNDGWGYSANWS